MFPHTRKWQLHWIGQARSLEDLGHIPFLSSGLVLKLMTHDTSRWKPTPLRLRLAAAQCEEEQKKGAAKAEVQAARQRSELPERSLSWRALSHGIGRCGNLVSFLILFDPVFANLHFTLSRSFSCSHMGENCRAETSNTLVESFWIFNLILQCAFGIFPQTVWLHWGVLNVGCRLVVGYPIVSFFS